MVPYTLVDMKENFLPWRTVNVVVQKDGSVIFMPPVTMKTWCKVNYENWPFGEQVSTKKYVNGCECFLTF